MSDVINSIFGRAQNETPSSGGYGYGSTETAEATAPAAETTEAEDTTVGEAADVDGTEESDTDSNTDEAVAEEDEASDEDDDEAVAEDDTVAEDAVAEESDEDAAEESGESGEDSDEAVAEEVAEEPEAAEEPAVAAAEPEAARPAAGSRGSTTVADGVVTKIVMRVARQAEGVHELDEAGTSVEVEGEVATIAVTLVVEFGRAVKTLAEQIRVKVIEGVEEYLGLEVASVDVHVADIYFPDAD